MHGIIHRLIRGLCYSTESVPVYASVIGGGTGQEHSQLSHSAPLEAMKTSSVEGSVAYSHVAGTVRFVSE